MYLEDTFFLKWCYLRKTLAEMECGFLLGYLFDPLVSNKSLSTLVCRSSFKYIFNSRTGSISL